MNKYIYTTLGSSTQKEIRADKVEINANGDLTFWNYESNRHSRRPKEFNLYASIAAGKWEQFGEANE